MTKSIKKKINNDTTRVSYCNMILHTQALMKKKMKNKNNNI